MISISELKQNESGVITEINAQGKMKRRILDMGIVPGTEIILKRKAPLCDPLEFYVLGYRLSLRKSDAKLISCERRTGRRIRKDL